MFNDIQITALWDTFDVEYNGKGVIQSATYKYLVEGAEDEKNAILAVLASDEVPKGIDNIATISNVEMDERVNETTYKVNVNYSSTEQDSSDSDNDDEDAEPTMSFDTSGGTSTINFAKWQKALKDGSPEVGLAINWNNKMGDDCEVKGVEIVMPSLRETWTKTVSTSTANNTSFKRKIAKLTGKVNSRKFKGWDEGEVLFLGASFTADESKKKTTVTYSFSIRFNEVVTVEDTGKKYDKYGHEYVWVIPGTHADKKENFKIKVEAEGVYLARVYDYADLNELGI